VGVGRGLRVGRGVGENPGVGDRSGVGRGVGVGVGVSTGVAVGVAVGVGVGLSSGEGVGLGVGVTEVFGTGTIAATSRPSFLSIGTFCGTRSLNDENITAIPAAKKIRPLTSKINLIVEDIFRP
jgi:hypothetical protein